MPGKSLRGSLLVFASAVLYGTYGVWSRLMGDNFQPFYQTWVRSLIIILLMTPLMLASRSFRKIERADYPLVALFVGFCIFTQVPLYYAFNHAPIGAVQLIFYSVFIITAYVMGRFYLGEKITKVKLISMALAFVGLAFVFGDTVITFAPLGLALAAFNGVASGGEMSSSKRPSVKYPPALLAWWGWVFTLLLHLPISLLIGEHQVSIHLSTSWLWLLVYSVVNMSAFWISLIGFSYVDASVASIIGLAEVIWAVVFGALIFGESLTVAVYLGGTLILVAAALPDVTEILQRKWLSHSASTKS
jgi:drug/metabolite transporter (DMT)-like permease